MFRCSRNNEQNHIDRGVSSDRVQFYTRRGGALQPRRTLNSRQSLLATILIHSTGREWYYHPVDELIYQEHSERDVTGSNYPMTSLLRVREIAAHLLDSETDEAESQDDPEEEEDRAIAWKRLRPSVFRTVCKSMYIGALISLLTAIFVGSVYMFFSFVCYKTINNCELHPKRSIPLQMQWTRSLSRVISRAFLYAWFFTCISLFLFRPYQLTGVKRKLFLVCCLVYCTDILYRVALQALGISYSKLTNLQTIPLNLLFAINICFQACILTKHFRQSTTRRRVTLFLQFIVPVYFGVFLAVPSATLIYPAYMKQDKEGKLLIAIFAPLIGVVLKVISRIIVQRLWNITHPGYSYVLLAPLYCAAAVMFRVLEGRSGQCTVHCYSWNNSRRCRSHRTKHHGCD